MATSGFLFGNLCSKTRNFSYTIPLNAIKKNFYLKIYNMKYRVHKIEVKSENMQEKLELYLNKLDGEVVSIIPNVRPTFQLMGATAKIDYILVVEKQK